MNPSLTKFIWSHKIDVSEYTGDEQHYLILREPNTAEFKQLVKVEKDIINDDSEERVFDALETFAELTKTLIIDHDFYEDMEKTKRLSAKDISELMSSKIDMIKYVMGEYMQALPLQSGK